MTSCQAPPSQEALGQLPTWAVPGWTWAPEVIRLPSGQTGQSQYVMYYGVRHCGAQATPCPSGSGIAANNHLCIAVATSSTPAGPFTTSSKPLICSSSQDSIDPSPFLDSSGKLYLYWKSNALFYGATLYGQQLSSTGLALAGSSVVLLHKSSSSSWQGNNIEAPAMVPSGTGRYDLFYSGNYFASRNYAIGYAECSGPLTGCTNQSTSAAWFSTPTPSGSPSSTTACYPNDPNPNGNPAGPNGPGGQSFLRDDSGRLVSPCTGQLVMAYHGWGGVIGPAPRFMWIATVTWSSGRPVRPDTSWMGTPCST